MSEPKNTEITKSIKSVLFVLLLIFAGLVLSTDYYFPRAIPLFRTRVGNLQTQTILYSILYSVVDGVDIVK